VRRKLGGAALNIAEFRITIGDGPTVRVEYTTATGERDEIPGQELKLKPLHRRTLEFLIRLLREGRLTAEHDYQILGENLFAALFYDETQSNLNNIGHKLTEAMRAARPVSLSDDDGLLRITLNFEEARTDLCNWPWEYLYSPERPGEGEARFFIAQRTKMALTRYVTLRNTRRANPAEEPLKVLLVAPSSTENPVESGSVREELEGLRTDGVIRLTCLPNVVPKGGPSAPVTYRDFESALGWEPHVIHFLGHGRHIEVAEQAVGQLAFTDEQGEKTRWVGDQQLANTLDDFAPSLHLVFLQACESGESTATHSYQVIAGVAQAVFNKSIPAVVAMHYQLRGEIGSALSREFYGKLAECRSVLLALNHARREIGLDTDDRDMWAAFGLPVLYLRGSGVISSPESASQGGSPRNTASATRASCPLDGEVQAISEPPTCPTCTRLLRCPDCGYPRQWASNKCKNCEQRTYTDADLDISAAAQDEGQPDGIAAEHDGFSLSGDGVAGSRLTGGGPQG
jgi:hypothetical protein